MSLILVNILQESSLDTQLGLTSCGRPFMESCCSLLLNFITNFAFYHTAHSVLFFGKIEPMCLSNYFIFTLKVRAVCPSTSHAFLPTPRVQVERNPHVTEPKIRKRGTSRAAFVQFNGDAAGGVYMRRSYCAGCCRAAGGRVLLRAVWCWVEVGETRRASRTGWACVRN